MNSKIVKWLWRNQEGAYAFVSMKAAEEWHDYPLRPDFPTEAMVQPEGTDLFFTPLTFGNDRRLAHNAVNPGVLFADLDPVNPQELSIMPSIAWETSPGSYQAVWILTEPTPYLTKWSDLNRRMTYFTGADKGGWSASKVLRWPGSVNYKYPEQPQGRVLWANLDHHFELEWLDSKLPDLTNLKVEEGSEAPHIEENKNRLAKMWEQLPPRLQWKLKDENVKDRSVHIVRVAHMMREADVDPYVAFQMLWYAPWNKWRFRNNPDRLWTEVCNVYEPS